MGREDEIRGFGATPYWAVFQQVWNDTQTNAEFKPRRGALMEYDVTSSMIFHNIKSVSAKTEPKWE